MYEIELHLHYQLVLKYNFNFVRGIIEKLHRGTKLINGQNYIYLYTLHGIAKYPNYPCAVYVLPNIDLGQKGQMVVVGCSLFSSVYKAYQHACSIRIIYNYTH